MTQASPPSPPPAATADDQAQRRRQLVQSLGILPILILIGVLFSVLTPNFLHSDNLLNILRQAAINIVLAAGMTFVILTGGIDLSVGSILGATAVAALSLSLDPSLSWAAIPIGLLAGLVLGMLNGTLVAYLGLPPFIVTLGTYTALRGLAYLLANGTTVINSSLPWAWIGNGAVLGVPWLIIIAFLVILVSWFILRFTVLGTHVYAVGGNPQAARLTGIRVAKVLMFVYALNGLYSGLGGVMSASRLYSANGLLGQGYELDAIAAVVLGGTSLSGGVGSIWGTLIGALIIAMLNNGLTLMNVSFFWQLVVKGIVIIVAVLIDRLRSRGQTAH